MSRNFYLLGHNPDNVSEAIQCLKEGTNALEPDVCSDGKAEAFSVQEQLPCLPKFLSRWIYGGVPLVDYLTGLKDYLSQNPGANLALLALDLKELERGYRRVDHGQHPGLAQAAGTGQLVSLFDCKSWRLALLSTNISPSFCETAFCAHPTPH